MKQQEFENLNKEDLFLFIKNKHANMAKKELIFIVVVAVLMLVPAIYLFSIQQSKEAFFLLSILFLVTNIPLVDYWKFKKTGRFDDAEGLLNWYDKLSNKSSLWRQILIIPASLAVGYILGFIIHNIEIENLDLGWYILALLLLLAFMFALLSWILAYKEKDFFKDEYIKRLQELIDKEK